VPKGTPAALITRLHAAMAKSLVDPAMLESFVRGSMEAAGGTPADFGEQARADSVKYERLVRELNIKTN
jgi:tripartite-type tricarboxylate transporter receptor subunit TctC